MAIITFTADMFLAAFQRLLPRGRAWPRDADAVQTQAFATLMPTYVRLAARDNNLLVDAFPATTTELLPEWELSLGLPDPCAGESPVLSSRKAQVLARFEAVGGQSVPYLIQFAATLGYPITITEFVSAQFDRMQFDASVFDDDDGNTWQINAPSVLTRYFKFDVDAFEEPYVFPETTVLECEMRRLSPAHTRLIFNYS